MSPRKARKNANNDAGDDTPRVLKLCLKNIKPSNFRQTLAIDAHPPHKDRGLVRLRIDSQQKQKTHLFKQVTLFVAKETQFWYILLQFEYYRLINRLKSNHRVNFR